MAARRIVWPPWICFGLGLCAAGPYLLFFASLAGLVREIPPPFASFTGFSLFGSGLVLGLLSVAAGWVLLEGERHKTGGIVAPCALGIALGGVGILGNILMFFVLRGYQ